MQTQAVVVHRTGGNDVLSVESLDVHEPREGEIRIAQSAIGLNFADIYQRRGSYGPHAAQTFPFVPGSEGAGIVEAIGSGVDQFAVGDRVACLFPGAYQALRNVPAAAVVKLPAGVPLDLAGSNFVRGLTAEYLLRRLYVVKEGDPILIHAAAGGMGVILAQWARALGALVIGTVGSDEKVPIALAHGCHHVINYRSEDFAARVLQLTSGEGVAVVYDSVGKDVFVKSLTSLRPLGLAINYGTVSGDVEALDLNLLHSKSLQIARPTLRTFTTKPGDLQRGADSLFDAMRSGVIELEVINRYALADVARAHDDLENRRTTGAALLVP